MNAVTDIDIILEIVANHITSLKQNKQLWGRGVVVALISKGGVRGNFQILSCYFSKSLDARVVPHD